MPLGQYESQTANALKGMLRAGACFYDIGANAGYFTLLGSLAVEASGNVIAFEPMAHNAATIRRQCELNDRVNVDVREVAVSDKSGRAVFVVESVNANSHLQSVIIEHAGTRPIERVEVEVVTLDDLVGQGLRPPDVIKVDVEGAEDAVLRGAEVTLRTWRPMLVVSTHSAELMHACRERLQGYGYCVEVVVGLHHELVAVPSQGRASSGSPAGKE